MRPWSLSFDPRVTWGTRGLIFGYVAPLGCAKNILKDRSADMSGKKMSPIKPRSRDAVSGYKSNTLPILWANMIILFFLTVLRSDLSTYRSQVPIEQHIQKWDLLAQKYPSGYYFSWRSFDHLISPQGTFMQASVSRCCSCFISGWAELPFHFRALPMPQGKVC